MAGAGKVLLALCATALAAVPLAAPARAQASNNAPPAERMAVSPGGVDMRSGRYAYEQTDLAIGGESGGLSLARTLAQQVPGHANPFGNFSHNMEVLLSEKRIDLFHNIYTHETGRPDYQIEIALGGLSQTFRASGAQNAGFEQTSRAGFGSLTHAGDRANGTAVYTFTAGDGTQAVFRPIGSADCSTALRCAAVAQITEPDGTRLDFTYDNQGSPNTTRLRSVTSSRGFALLLEYDGALVVKACLLNLAVTPKPANNVCPAGAQAVSTYTYVQVSGQHRLASATDGAGATSAFTYGSGTTGFVRPGETSPWLTNSAFTIMDEEGLVSEIIVAQAFADGSAYNYSYDHTPAVTGQQQKIAGGAYTDILGNTTVLRYDFPILPNPGGGGNVPGDDQGAQPNVYQVTPGPVEIVDPLGRVSRVDYCDANAMANLSGTGLNRCIVMPMPVSTTDPEGIKTHFVTDMFARNVLERRQVAKPGSPLPDIIARATYSCIPATARYCNKPLTQTDPNGNVSEFTYAPEHGGVLTETGPAPTPGAPRPQTRHIYAQRTAWISNGTGGWTQAASPVWLRVASSSCRTSAATGNPASPCATAGDEVRTELDYGPDAGPNNLLPRGQAVSADGVTLRTCYAYDALGRRIAEAQPNASLASCPAALAGGAPFTSYTRYDAAGRMAGSISADPDGAGPLPLLAVRHSYDLAGRLLKVETGSLAAWQSETVAPASWTGFTLFRALETQYDSMSRRLARRCATAPGSSRP